MTIESYTDRIIGHVVGFMHEHERLDARRWTTFDCGALSKYEDAKSRVASIEDGPAFDSHDSVDDRMNLV